MSRAIQSLMRRNVPRIEPALLTSDDDDLKHQERLMLPDENILIGTVSLAEDDPIQDDGAEDASQESPSKNRDRIIEELQKREQALHEALGIVCRLAAMDTNTYQTKLVQNALPPIPDDVNTSLLARLSQSIHRLHASVTNLQEENEAQTTEIHELQASLEESRNHGKKLNRAVHKLHKKNERLQTKLQGKESMAAKIMHQVQQRVQSQQRKQDEDFLKLATQVQQHELNMVHLQKATRERCDSGISDMDGLQDFDGASSVGSVMSLQSLVTDDGVATLRMSSDRNETWPPLEVHSDLSRRTPPPPGLERPSTPPPRSVTRDDSSSKQQSANPFSALFSASKVAHPYTLSIVAPVGLQFVKIKLSQDQIKQSPSLNASVSGNVVNNGEEESSDAVFAFLVCGYQGFDSNVNVKPTVGARLLSIDKELIPSSITTDELLKQIASKGRSMKLTFRNDTLHSNQREQWAAACQQFLDKSDPNSSLGATSPPRPSFMRIRGSSGDSIGKMNISKMGFWNKNASNSSIGGRSSPHRSNSGKSTGIGHHESPPTISRVGLVGATPDSTGSISPYRHAVSSMFTRARTRSEQETLDLIGETDDTNDDGLSGKKPPAVVDGKRRARCDSEDRSAVMVNIEQPSRENSASDMATSVRLSNSSLGSQSATTESLKNSMKSIGKLFTYNEYLEGPSKNASELAATASSPKKQPTPQQEPPKTAAAAVTTTTTTTQPTGDAQTDAAAKFKKMFAFR